ncbi:MAG TPA: CDP-alcohol phosphatidyltransferase family protein [Streptosporangiaceae bacterium]|nr:CDP-alcohol phosphatidyltransferase family protein [Streptosporangiaceae bacterium]
MLNALRPVLDRVLIPIGRALARTGVTPNEITVVGTVGVSCGALSLFPTGHLFAGTMVCTAFVLTDMLDGAVARVTGSTGSWGAFLDSTMDRIADAAVFSGLVLWFFGGGRSRLLAGVALFCLVASLLVSYAKARAEGLGLRCGIGIAERPERMLVCLVSTGLAGLGVPYVLAAGLWLIAAGSVVTFGQRVLDVRRGALAAPTTPPPAPPTAPMTPQPTTPQPPTTPPSSTTPTTPPR